MKRARPRVARLAILDGYKVRWSRETVARDIVQNFFDEADDFRDVRIDVDDAAKRVTVSGPSEFALDYLRYVGATTKQSRARRTAGGFGEGFKVCALVLLRDYGCEVIAGSGAWELCAVLHPMKFGRELRYEIGAVDPPRAGSFVRIDGADKLLRAQFKAAKDLFRHGENPRLAKPIHVDEAAGIGVYHATDARRGDLYYRRQHRGHLRFGRGAALTFAFDDRLAPLDGDRDRRNLSAALPLLAALAARLPDAVLEQLVRHLRVYWQEGNGALTVFAREAAKRKLVLAFKPRWLARVRHGYKLEAHAEKLGFHLATPKMADLGMPTVEARFGMTKKPRAPTPVEAARMGIAAALYVALAKTTPLFRTFRVVDLDAGGSRWGSKVGVVDAAHLAASFDDGAAPCLAALAVGQGRSARRNADRLTALLEGAVAKSGELTSFRERWAEAALDPTRERAPWPAGDVEEDWRLPRVFVLIAAPSGFPVVTEIERRLEEAAGAAGASVHCIHVKVNTRRAAVKTLAHGVPSLWIGGERVEPRDGTTPSCELRTYEGEAGPSLAPTVEVLRRGIAAVMKLGRQHRRVWPHERARDAYLGLLRREAPRAYAREVIAAAVTRAPAPEREYAPMQVARELASQSLRRAPFDVARLDQRAAAAMAKAVADVDALVEALKAAAPGLGDESREAVLGKLVDRARDLVETGSLEAARAELTTLAPAAMELVAQVAKAPVDETCAAVCVGRGVATLLAARNLDAIASARAVTDAAIARAIERHGLLDEEGEPLECSDLDEDLARNDPAVPEPVDAIAQAVEVAWHEAIARGATELEAGARALAVAVEMGEAVERARDAED